MISRKQKERRQDEKSPKLGEPQQLQLPRMNKTFKRTQRKLIRTQVDVFGQLHQIHKMLPSPKRRYKAEDEDKEEIKILERRNKSKEKILQIIKIIAPFFFFFFFFFG